MASISNVDTVTDGSLLSIHRLKAFLIDKSKFPTTHSFLTDGNWSIVYMQPTFSTREL